MALPQQFAKYGLVGPKKPARRRLVMTSEGGPGSGKTDFFYRTFPRPALVIQLDLNDEGVRERYEGDELFFKDVIVPPFVGKHTAEQRDKDMVIAAEVRNLYNQAVDSDYFRSIMIDEGKAMYTLCRRAFLTDLDFGGAQQASYAPINSWMDRFFTLAKQHRINFYVPHRQTDERQTTYTREGKKTSTPTGGLIAAGWKDALYASQCHVLFTKTPMDMSECDNCGLKKTGEQKCTCPKFKRKDPLSKFDMQIVKCTANTKVEGMIYNGADITLANLGQTVFPLSDESDWVTA